MRGGQTLPIKKHENILEIVCVFQEKAVSLQCNQREITRESETLKIVGITKPQDQYEPNSFIQGLESES